MSISGGQSDEIRYVSICEKANLPQ